MAGDNGYRRSKPGSLYVTEAFLGRLGVIKFGVANKDVDGRIRQEAPRSGGVQKKVRVYSCGDGAFAADAEKAIKRHFGTTTRRNAARRLGMKFCGSTESIEMDELEALLQFVDEFSAKWGKRHRRRIKVEVFSDIEAAA